MNVSLERWLPLAVVVALVLLPLPALAGRTAHLLTEESQIVPEGGVELEQWLWAKERSPDSPTRPVVKWMWWGPVVGVSPQLELSAPLQIANTTSGMVFASLELDARYRLVPRENDLGFQPLVRLAYVQSLNPIAGPSRVDADLVATEGGPTALRISENLGARIAMPWIDGDSGPVTATVTAAVGASIPLSRELRLAAELEGELPTANPGSALLSVGPSLSWTHGPFWVTLGSLIGLTSNTPRYFPRVLWAISL